MHIKVWEALTWTPEYSASQKMDDLDIDLADLLFSWQCYFLHVLLFWATVLFKKLGIDGKAGENILHHFDYFLS